MSTAGLPGADQPRDICVRWATTLTEPLLPLGTRIRAERDLSTLCRKHPDYMVIFFAGVIADLVCSLPEDDPWAKLSARFATLTVGDNPPRKTGAATPSGDPFGTFQDALDLTSMIFPSPSVDPALVALAEPLTASAAALIGFGRAGWKALIEALTAIAERPPVDVAGPSPVQSLGPTTVEAPLYETATSAIRWLAHRRRSHGLLDDGWPVESVILWSWRAQQEVNREAWPTNAVSDDIRRNKLTFAPDDF